MKRESTHSVAVVGVETPFGAELVRLLDKHAGFDLRFLGTARQAGVTLGRVHPHLGQGDRLLYPADINLMPDVDVVFADVAEGEAWKLARDLLDRGVRLIDLGYEFRFDSAERYLEARDRKHPAGGWSWQYGLAESFPDEVSAAEAVAVPGPVASAVALVAGPPLNEGLIAPEPLVVDAAIDPDDRLSSAVEAEQALELETGARPRVTVRAVTPRWSRVGEVSVIAQVSEGSNQSDLVEALSDAHRSSNLTAVGGDFQGSLMGSARSLVRASVDPRTGVATLTASFDPMLLAGPGLGIRCANLMFGDDPLAGVPIAGLTPP